MEAGGLQRSEISFRRTGSSGLVWDDKFLGELAKIKPASQEATDAEPRRASSAAAASDSTTLLRSRSEGRQRFKTMKVPSPSLDPPSPKVSGCGGICSIFGGGHPARNKRAKVGKRRA